MGDMWTIKAALDWTVGYLERKGDENPRLSAEWLLSEACDMSRIQLYVSFDRPLSLEERDILRGYVTRRGKGEPLQYITGYAAFRHIQVKVRPGVLILDEPTAGLDPAGCRRILETICDYSEKTGSTVVIVRHSMDDVARIADRLIVFNHGSIRFDGTPEEVFSNPKELSDIGLSVPAPTQIASALREQGVEIEGSVYTTEQLLAALLKLKKEVGRNA